VLSFSSSIALYTFLLQGGPHSCNKIVGLTNAIRLGPWFVVSLWVEFVGDGLRKVAYIGF